MAMASLGSSSGRHAMLWSRTSSVSSSRRGRAVGSGDRHGLLRQRHRLRSRPQLGLERQDPGPGLRVVLERDQGASAEVLRVGVVLADPGGGRRQGGHRAEVGRGPEADRGLTGGQRDPPELVRGPAERPPGLAQRDEDLDPGQGIRVRVALHRREPTFEVGDGRAGGHRLHGEHRVGERARAPGTGGRDRRLEGGVGGEGDEQRLVRRHRGRRRRAPELLDEQVPALLVDPEGGADAAGVAVGGHHQPVGRLSERFGVDHLSRRGDGLVVLPRHPEPFGHRLERAQPQLLRLVAVDAQPGRVEPREELRRQQVRGVPRVGQRDRPARLGCHRDRRLLDVGRGPVREVEAVGLVRPPRSPRPGRRWPASSGRRTPPCAGWPSRRPAGPRATRPPPARRTAPDGPGRAGGRPARASTAAGSARGGPRRSRPARGSARRPARSRARAAVTPSLRGWIRWGCRRSAAPAARLVRSCPGGCPPIPPRGHPAQFHSRGDPRWIAAPPCPVGPPAGPRGDRTKRARQKRDTADGGPRFRWGPRGSPRWRSSTGSCIRTMPR